MGRFGVLNVTMAHIRPNGKSRICQAILGGIALLLMNAGCGHPSDGIGERTTVKSGESNSKNAAATREKEPNKIMMPEPIRIERRDQLPLLVGRRVLMVGIVAETKGRVFIRSDTGDFGVDLNAGSHNVVDKYVKVVGTLASKTVHSLPRQPASRTVQTNRYRDKPEQWDRYYITEFTIIEEKGAHREAEGEDQLEHKANAEKAPLLEKQGISPNMEK
jgi:hypothetical protein